MESKDEIWKDIKDFEGLYQISTYGRIKSLPKQQGRRITKEKIMAQRVNRKGYHHACLTRDMKQIYKYAHRLVADAFIPNPLNLPFVNHIDGNKLNNNTENLEWISHRDNILHGWENGLMENVRKAPAIQFGHKCKLINIKNNETFAFKSYKELSRFLGFNETWLSNSLRQCSDYENTCYKKGYRIELITNRKGGKGTKYKIRNINNNEVISFNSAHELCKYLNKTTGWLNYSKQVNKLNKDLLEMGFKLEVIN